MTDLRVRKTVLAITLAVGLAAPSVAAAADYHDILSSPTRVEGTLDARMNSMRFQDRVGLHPEAGHALAKTRATRKDMLRYNQPVRLWQNPMMLELHALKKRKSLVQMQLHF